MCQEEAFIRSLEELMAEIGFARHDQIYAMALTPEVLGCVHIGMESKPREGRFEVNVVIGVRHQETERLVAQLKGRPRTTFSPFTLGCQIGYLMPEKKHISYILGNTADSAAIAKRISDGVLRYGIPYMRKIESLAAIVELMSSEKSATSAVNAAYRLPVALYLSGNMSMAFEAYAGFAEKYATKGGGVLSNQYRDFGAAFLKLAGSA